MGRPVQQAAVVMSSVGTVAAHQLCGPLRWKRESPVQPNNPDAVVVDDSGDNAGRALLTIVSAQHEELVILTVQGSIDAFSYTHHRSHETTRLI